MKAFKSVVGGFLYFPGEVGMPEEFVCVQGDHISAEESLHQYLSWITDWEEISVSSKEEAIEALGKEHRAQHMAELFEEVLIGLDPELELRTIKHVELRLTSDVTRRDVENTLLRAPLKNESVLALRALRSRIRDCPATSNLIENVLTLQSRLQIVAAAWVEAPRAYFAELGHSQKAIWSSLYRKGLLRTLLEVSTHEDFDLVWQRVVSLRDAREWQEAMRKVGVYIKPALGLLAAGREETITQSADDLDIGSTRTSLPGYLGRAVAGSREAWYRIASLIELCGTCGLISVVVSVICALLARSRAFNDAYIRFFVGEPPNGLIVATCVFVVTLSFGLLVQRWYRTSFWCLRRNMRIMHRLTDSGWISSEQYATVVRWFLADHVMRDLGADAARMQDIEQFANQAAFQKMFSLIGHGSARSQQGAGGDNP